MSAPTWRRLTLSNDAVVPIDQSHPGCPWNKDGLCPIDTIASALKNRLAEIDFDYDCFGNYTFQAGQNYGGRAPRS